MKLSDRLGIQKGLTAVIGSGGKTTMLRVLAQELQEQGTVILTTSTHILPFVEYLCLLSPTEADVRCMLDSQRIVCVGERSESGKLGPCTLSWQRLTELADFVLVEADGSKRLPLKAHAAHEPVIPENSGRTICVVGASGLGKPIREVVHRPEIFCRLSGCDPETQASAEAVAGVLRKENLADLYYVNQSDLSGAKENGEIIAKMLEKETICGSLFSYIK